MSFVDVICKSVGEYHLQIVSEMTSNCILSKKNKKEICVTESKMLNEYTSEINNVNLKSPSSPVLRRKCLSLFNLKFDNLVYVYE